MVPLEVEVSADEGKLPENSVGCYLGQDLAGGPSSSLTPCVHLSGLP